jgi:hypothetical protein
MPKMKACERRRVPYKNRCLICLVDKGGLEGAGTQWQSGETGGAREGRPRHSRIFRMDSGEWITASKRIRP